MIFGDGVGASLVLRRPSPEIVNPRTENISSPERVGEAVDEDEAFLIETTMMQLFFRMMTNLCGTRASTPCLQ
jgi:hypothetical protein